MSGPVTKGACNGCDVEDIFVRDYSDSFAPPRTKGSLMLCEFCANTPLGNAVSYPSSTSQITLDTMRGIAWSHHRLMREIREIRENSAGLGGRWT